MKNKSLSKKLEDILGLTTSPVAIKLIKADEPLPSIKEPTQRSRYCQLLMLAKKGQPLMLTAESIACPAAKAALGLGPLPEKISSGEMLCTLGLFMSKEAVAKTMSMIPRIELGSTKAVVAGPLRDFPMEPDVIVIESVPEHIMWLALARNFEEGGRLSFNSSIFQAECVDVTTVPYLAGELNMTPGCYGCRQATDTPPEHMFIGIPAKLLPEIVESLEALSEKAMKAVREKSVYALYAKGLRESKT
ncbi:DUF169 domain-containing protein [Candidatus Bathyarchaeota archaeon A05DMB-2]|nr:DUF169 domain-containing protein [Candidatus Bathyarchaeota archaeon A05DMB-2]MDH7564771.1 DUF169 domain-containing protein [Candidatus Bathyarchaeota archaeon]